MVRGYLTSDVFDLLIVFPVKLPRSEPSSSSWEDVLKFERLAGTASGVKSPQHTL